MGDSVNHIVDVSHLLLCINSSANFLIYLLGGEKFRRAWIDTYCGRTGGLLCTRLVSLRRSESSGSGGTVAGANATTVGTAYTAVGEGRNAVLVTTTLGGGSTTSSKRRTVSGGSGGSGNCRANNGRMAAAAAAANGGGGGSSKRPSSNNTAESLVSLQQLQPHHDSSTAKADGSSNGKHQQPQVQIQMRHLNGGGQKKSSCVTADGETTTVGPGAAMDLGEGDSERLLPKVKVDAV